MRLSRELAAVQAGAEARAEAGEERIAALQAAVERLSAEAGAAADLAAVREQARLPPGVCRAHRVRRGCAEMLGPGRRTVSC